MANEEIKLTVTAATDSAVAGMNKVKGAVDGVSSSTKSAAISAEDLQKAMSKSLANAGAGFNAIKETMGPVIQGFTSIVGKAAQWDKLTSASGTETFSDTMAELKKAVDDVIVSVMTGSPSLLDGIKSVAKFITSVAKSFASLSPQMRTSIGVIVAVGVAIAVLTKIVIAFGIGMSAAIWPITLVVAAIAAVIAITVILKNNWELVTKYWELGVAKMKRWMDFLWSAVKIGALYIAQFMVGAARIMFMPMLKAIDAVIWAYNKLTGSHIQSVSDRLDAAQSGLDAQIAIEQQRMENAKQESETEIALSNDIQRIKDENRAKEAAEDKKRAENAKKNMQDRTANEKKELDKSKTDWQKYGKELSDIAKKMKEDKAKRESEMFENSKQGYQESSQFVLANLDKSSKSEFEIWKGLSIAQVMVDTYKAAMAAYAAFTFMGPVGVGLGAAAAAAVTTLGLRSAKNIANTKYSPKAERGALIRGSRLGTTITAGENNRSELIVPFENPDVMDKVGGGGTNNITINVENMLGDPKDFPVKLAQKIDAALYDLHRKKGSAFGESLA